MLLPLIRVHSPERVSLTEKNGTRRTISSLYLPASSSKVGQAVEVDVVAKIATSILALANIGLMTWNTLGNLINMSLPVLKESFVVQRGRHRRRTIAKLLQSIVHSERLAV